MAGLLSLGLKSRLPRQETWASLRVGQSLATLLSELIGTYKSMPNIFVRITKVNTLMIKIKQKKSVE